MTLPKDKKLKKEEIDSILIHLSVNHNKFYILLRVLIQMLNEWFILFM